MIMHPSKMMASLLAGIAIASCMSSASAQTITGYRAPKPGEKITATVMVHEGFGQFSTAAGFTKEVGSLRACHDFGRLRVLHGGAVSVVCSGDDEAPLAVYRCSSTKLDCDLQRLRP
jgi:hypothetical protein